MPTEPPQWIAWAADIGSTLGFIGTLGLGISTARLKGKYARLVRLFRHSIELAKYFNELTTLINTYDYSASGDFQATVSNVIGRLKLLSNDFKGEHLQLIKDSLSRAQTTKNKMSQENLENVRNDLGTLMVIVEGTRENVMLVN